MAKSKLGTAVGIFKKTGSRELARTVFLREQLGTVYTTSEQLLALARDLDKLDLKIIEAYAHSAGVQQLEAETHLIKMLEDSK